MKRIVVNTAKQILWAVLYFTIGALVAGVSLMVVLLNDRPDLHVWHRADLDEEFTLKSDVESFADYLALEGRLFEELDREVYAEVEPSDGRRLNRYNRSGPSDPRAGSATGTAASS